MAVALIDVPANIARIRILSDLKDSQYQTDADIENMMNEVKDELVGSLVEKHQNFFLKRVDIVPEGNKLLFPADLYKVSLLEQVYGNNNYRPIYQKTVEEVSEITGVYYFDEYYPGIFGYVLFPDHLELHPEEGAESYKFRLAYLRDPMNVMSCLLYTSPSPRD